MGASFPTPAPHPGAPAPIRPDEADVRALLEAAPDAMILVDAAGRIRLVNEQAEALFGYPRREVLGRPVELLLPERYRRRHRRHRDAFAAAPRRRPMGAGLDLWGRHRDGHEFPVEVSLSPVVFGGEGLVLSALRDVTERKHAEARQAVQYAVTRILAEAATIEAALPPLLHALCTGLGWELGEYWQVDPDGTHAQLVGLWHPPALPAAAFHAASAALTFAPGQGLIGAVWATGAPSWREDVGAAPDFARAAAAAALGLRGALGFPVWRDYSVTGVMVFFSRAVRRPDAALSEMMADLGRQLGQFVARRAAEAALRQAVVDTEQARTGAEQARRLAEAAQAEAERANAAKSEFLSRMSHELRTPLNSVLGFAQLLDLEPLTPVQRRNVARILKGGRHLLDLINEVLDIARIEAGRLQLSPEPVRVEEACARRLSWCGRWPPSAGSPSRPRRSTPLRPTSSPTASGSSRSCSTCSPTRSSTTEMAGASRSA
jgi:PAS domain S-box-containing protein